MTATGNQCSADVYLFFWVKQVEKLHDGQEIRQGVLLNAPGYELQQDPHQVVPPFYQTPTGELQRQRTPTTGVTSVGPDTRQSVSLVRLLVDASAAVYRLTNNRKLPSRAPPPHATRPASYLLMQRQHHVGEAGELKQHKEDELGGEVLPQQLAGSPDVGVEVLLGLGALHGVHHQVHQLLLQHRAALLVLTGGGRER